jgi:hypothetical protein
MTTREDVRAFLDRLDLPVESVAEDMWLVRTAEGAELVVHYAPLEFNARDLVHGSYGIEGDHVVLTDALELTELDFSEFEASVDSLSLALASHLNALAPFGGK